MPAQKQGVQYCTGAAEFDSTDAYGGVQQFYEISANKNVPVLIGTEYLSLI
jgi:hypothetical protein